MLRLLPRGFREESEAELLEVFRDAYARRGGARVRFWMRLTFDLLVTMVAERLAGAGTSSGATRSSGLHAAALDLTVAIRRLGRGPGHALMSAAALGIGLAATTLVVTLVRGVLLAPLPFPEPDRLARLLEIDSTGCCWYPSFPNIRDWREHASFLDGVVAADVPQVRSVLYDGGALRTSIGGVSRGFFRVLGVSPVAGRTFAAEENAPGGLPVALVSEEFWRGELAGRPLDELALTVGLETFAVIGVLPAGFRFLGAPGEWVSASVWLPLERGELGGRESHGYHTVARLRAGVTLATAAASMDRLAVEMKRRHGEGTQADRVRMTRLVDDVIGNARQPLHLLLAAALFVLLVTCFNLAAAVLARGLGRTRELAIRVALGARRRDLIRNLLIETGALALPGAAIGIALAALGLGALQRMQLAVPRLDEVRLDAAVLALTLGLALIVTLGAGLLPALVLSARDLIGRLRTHGATTHTRAQQYLWNGFIALQVALTLVLLTGTGLLLRSLHRVVTRDVGYQASDLLAVDVSLPELRYEDDTRRVQYYTVALARIRRMPGVEAAGLTNVLPHETSARTSSTRTPGMDAKVVHAGFRAVDPGYFDALGIRRVAGQPFGGTVLRRSDAVIDSTLARQLWGGTTPLEERVTNGFLDDTVTVTGTVGSIREWDQGGAIGVVYVDYRGRPDVLLDMHLVVRPATAAVAAAVRGALAEVDAFVPVTIERLESRIARTYGERRLLLVIAASFAAVTLLLAALGVYAVIAYAVGRELKSAAIRLTLGARPGRVIGGLLTHGLRPVMIGLGAGVLAAIPALAALRSQLFGVDAFDPRSAAAAMLLLAGTAALAAYLPARAAGRVDPSTILRPD
jgi:predicted permease